MLVRQSTTPRVPVRLMTSLGAPVTGVIPGDIAGGLFSVIKSDGTVVDIGATGGTFFEVDSVKAPGLYHLLLTAASTNLVGTLQWVLRPTATQFVAAVGDGAVENITDTLAAVKGQTDLLPASPANEVTVAAVKAKTDTLPASPANEVTVAAVKAKTDNLPGDPADQSDLSALLGAIEGSGFDTAIESLVATHTNLLAIKAKTDLIPATPASQSDVNAIPGAVWDQPRSAHVTANTFGELMRLLKQVFSGRCKVSEASGVFTIYQEDGTTALQIQNLKDVANNPAGLGAVERTAAL